MHSSSQFPLLISQSIGPGLYVVLLYIEVIGVTVVLYIPPSVVLLVFVTVIGIAVVISPSVVVSMVGIVIDGVTLVPPFVVASETNGVTETNGVELPPPSVVLSAVVTTVDVVVIWVDVVPLVIVSVVVSAVVIGSRVVTCTCRKRKIKNKSMKTNDKLLRDYYLA